MKPKSIKFWVNIITAAALIMAFIFARGQIVDAFKTFGSLNLIWLVLIIPIQIGNYFSVSKFYQSYLKSLGEKIRLWELYKVGLEMNFVNNVFPSGGASGFGYLSLRLKKLGVPGSKSALLQTSRHMLTFLSFIVYLLLALVLLSAFGSASRFIVLVATSLSSFIVFLTLVLIYIISSEERVTSFTAGIPKFINSVFGFFHKENKRLINIEKIEALFKDLHKDYVQVRKDWRSLRYPFFWALMMNFTEILTIFVVYLSFGELVNPGAIIVSYAVANIAGLFAILPGGIGVYEGLMTGVMTSAGVRQGLALSATVVYRVLNMGLFLPIGYFFYTRALAEGDVPPESLKDATYDEDTLHIEDE